jgi:MFS family permease
LDSAKGKPVTIVPPRSRGYVAYLAVLMTIVALMDWYISTIKTTMLPYALKEYNITAVQFSWTESLFLIPTFLVFLLNGLNDIIGRKWSIFILMLLMGSSCICIVYFTPSFLMFMAFYAVAMLTTVSNMWAIPIGEEAKAANRGKMVALVFTLGMLPLSAILPSILVDKMGLDWRWMYGVMVFMMMIGIVLWFFMKETQRYDQIKAERKAGTRKKHIFGLGVITKEDAKYIAIGSLMWICWLISQMLFFWAGYFFMEIKGMTLQQWTNGYLLWAMIAMLAGGILGGLALDKIGRKLTFVIGCIGMAISIAPIGILPDSMLRIAIIFGGFFIAFSYSWIVVYIPEIFPTERRGSCLGWTTTITRTSYVVGPILAAILLTLSPRMEWFWVVAGAIMIIPAVSLMLIKPYETRNKELEEIEYRL